MKTRKLGKLTVYFLVLVILAGCFEDRPCFKKPDGFIEAIVNGVEWEEFKPSKTFSTIIRFDSEISETNKCSNQDLKTISVLSFIDKRYIDFVISMNVEATNLSTYRRINSLISSDSKELCNSIPDLVLYQGSSGHLNAPYLIDTTHNNFIQITNVSNSKIEGNFDLKFIEKYQSGNDTTNIHLVCKKFIAVKYDLCDQGYAKF